MTINKIEVPVCTRCGVFMTCYKTGQEVHNVCGISWSGDTFECKACGARVTVNFGEGRRMVPQSKLEDSMLIK